MNQLPLIATILALTVIGVHAQQTEDFKSDALNGDRFSNNGQSFTITTHSTPDKFAIDGTNNAGWNGTARDHRFISNHLADNDYDGASFSISTTDGTDILVKSLYFYLSTSISFENPTMSTLTIEGKKARLPNKVYSAYPSGYAPYTDRYPQLTSITEPPQKPNPNPFCIFQAETNMMQKTLLLLLLLTGIIAVGQSKYMTKTGSISIEASQPTFEPIEASHTAVSALLNDETGELAVLALVRGFRFPLALMEEHFNENYIESHKYPKTSFKGSILNFDPNALSNQPRTVQLTGELSMHGVTNTINVQGRMTKTDGLITLESSFAVKTSDYAIEIPSLVRKQIDENVQIQVSLPLQPKQ